MSRHGLPVQERLAQRTGAPDETGCTNWLGAISDRGYGLITIDRRSRKAHRIAFEAVNGPLPDGLVLDHLCRNRRCVNLAHLEVVDPATNTLRGYGPTAKNARKTHCKEGHPYDGDNLGLYVSASGRVWRRCRACGRKRAQRDRARSSAA